MNNYNVNKIYQDMEIHLIDSMKRNLSRHLKEEAEYGFQWTQWQVEKLKELKRYQRQNASIIGNVENKISKEVKEQLREQFIEGSKSAQKQFKKALKKGYKIDRKVNKSFFKINDRKVDNLIKSVNNDLEVANAATLRMINDEYREVIHKAVMFAGNGVMTEKQAIDMATKSFLTRGLNSIQYKNGARVNIASYSQMAVRTANQRAYLQGEGDFRKKIGNPLVIISRHGTACELCQQWEGQVLIDDVYSGGSKEDGNYPLLSEAMKQGLYHPNCEHGLGTYYPELDDIEYDDHSSTEETNSYQQDINYCNLQIQKYNRLAAGSLDEENVAYYTNKKQQWEERKPVDFIDIKNNKLIHSRLEEYENSILNETIENAYIISSNGEVFNIKGNEYSIAIPKWLNTKNAIITHNHPINQTHFSFSADDIRMFLNGKLKELRGIDEKYQYTLLRTQKTKYKDLEMIENKFNYDYHIEAIELSMLGKLDIDYDEYDYIVNKLSKEYNFIYKRVKR